MTGLETRGIHPEPGARGAVAAYLYSELDREWRRQQPIVSAMASHRFMWGVWCGPTLSMVHPPVLLGIGANAMIEHVPAHECELIEPDGSVWSLGGISLGARFTVFGVTGDDVADVAARLGITLEPWQRQYLGGWSTPTEVPVS